jgi:hypothetical protein
MSNFEDSCCQMCLRERRVVIGTDFSPIRWVEHMRDVHGVTIDVLDFDRLRLMQQRDTERGTQ